MVHAVIVSKGEGVTDESVWVIKSHYPERLGYVRFEVSRVIVVIRNPYDALLSYFHMGMTNTHSNSLTPSVCEMKYNSVNTFKRIS